MPIAINDAIAMEALGANLASLVQGGEIIYLIGELGVGKTTLVRGFVHKLGHLGNVKSPTYTLIEPYSISDRDIYHFDLYRINDPEELEAIGIRDYCNGEAICLIEWPEQGLGLLPKADIVFNISYLEQGRQVDINADSMKGQNLLKQLEI